MTKPDTGVDSQNQQMILGIIDSLKQQAGALLPILHEIQASQGYVPTDAVPMIAEGLNISRADVHGVISFYHYFRTNKPGNYVIQLCRAESCQAMGAVALEKHVKQKLAIDFHETTDDGMFSLEPVYCLGNCACSPSMTIADDVHGEVDTAKFDQLIAALQSNKAGAL